MLCHFARFLLGFFVTCSIFTSMTSAQTAVLSVEPIFQPNPTVLLPGGQLSAHVLLDNSEAVQGWSYGICSDPTLLLIDGFEDGAATQVVNNGGPPDFNEVSAFPEGITVGVVISFTGAATLPAGVDAELQTIDYTLDPSVMQPAAGDPDLETVIISCDTIGFPAVQTVVVANGASVTPAQEGTFVVIPAEAECELTCMGGVDFAELVWNDCNPGGPADYYLLFRDGDQIALFDDATQSFSDLGLAPGSYHYELISVTFPTPTSPPQILQGSCDVDVIPVSLTGFSPDRGTYLGGTPITVTGTGFLAASDTTIEICGQTALDIVVVDDSTITCTTPATDFIGSVNVSVSNSFGDDSSGPFIYGFIRGQITANLTIDLEDPVFALNWMFGGGTAPICQDTVDVNADGLLDLADPIYLIEYLFAGGVAPPEPFNSPGVGDPTNSVECLPMPPC